MCTSIAFNLDSFYFGRNLDLDKDFGDGVIITPRNFPLSFRCGKEIRTHYAFVGMGTAIDGCPLYADGMNEHGLCIAGLDFKGNAHYNREFDRGRVNLAPFEIIPYLLGVCKDINGVKEELCRLVAIDVPFSDKIPNSPLHFHIADRSGSIALEFTRGGVNAYDNPYGVLTNNPPFPFHRDNMALYQNLSNGALSDRDAYCNGILARGLPGDYSSPSRFVKAAWLAKTVSGHGGDISLAFSVMYAVAPPKYAVFNIDGEPHFTRYTSIMGDGKYAIRLYGELIFTVVDIKKESLDSEALIIRKIR